MFIGRKDELNQLESVFNTEHSNVLVLYGREGIGKTATALKFCEKRQMIYYNAVPISEDEQAKKLNALVFEEVQKSAPAEKRVVVIDEFQNITSVDSLLKLVALTTNEADYGRIMLLLLSSSINWVENSMITINKEFSHSITGIIKLKELNFSEIVDWFPKLPAKDCVVILSVLGGVPKYLKLWQENRRVRENILSLFFSTESPLLNEAEYQLKLELRELNAYNTILYALALGNYKLNDLYSFTGYSRAKISVYLKNLIEMDFVEKIYSVKVKNIENTQKGLYKIKDHFLNFYYAYVFANLTPIICGKGRNVYNEVAEKDFDRYMRTGFGEVCMEYLELMSKYKRLGYRYSEWKSWYGKKGTLDLVGQDDDRHTFVAICKYNDSNVGMDSVEELYSLIEDAGIKPSQVCIFARNGFSDEVKNYSKNHQLMTVSLDDF